MLYGLLALIWFGGWVLGIAGFFLARAAMRRVDALQRELARQAAAADSAAATAARAVDHAIAPHAADQATAIPSPAMDQATMPAADRATAPTVVADTHLTDAAASVWVATAHPEVTAPAGTASPSTPPAEPSTPPPPAPKPAAIDIEALLAMRWGVWLGALALVLAGVFLIRYAADQGLLGPAPRCGLSGLLGVALVAAAEYCRRHDLVRPGAADLVPPALAAAGVAVLYGAAYGAGAIYALIPPGVDFVLMAAASLAGLALSLRHGALVAAIGLVGAFVTPALVQTANPSFPGLFAYLLFVTAAALAVVRFTAWVWLGWASTIAGAVWVLLAILDGVGIDAWAPALFVPAAAALNLVLLPAEALDQPIGRRLAWIPVAALGATGLLLAIVDQESATRAGVLLLTPITIGKAGHEPRLRLLPFIAATTFLLLLCAWSVEVALQSAAAPIRLLPTGQALLDTAAFIAGCFAASGLWFERRSPRPLSWSCLAASVPVLTLAVCYARVALLSPRLAWGAAALLLAAGLSAASAASLREQGRWAAPDSDARAHAGVHAAGAAAAVALGLAMVLREHWLTLALSLLLPLLAWIAAQVELPALRKVALAAALVVLLRLLPDRFVLAYTFGGMPALDGWLLAYGVPAAAFALAATMFRRRGDDLTVGVLEAGTVALLTVLAALEIRQACTGSIVVPALSFSEATLQVMSAAVIALATMRIATRLGRPVLHACWRVLGGIAIAGGVLLIVANPLLTGETVGALPIVDWLLPAYLLPAMFALLALRHPATREPAELRRVLAAYALIAAYLWLVLEIRHLFHRGDMSMFAAPVIDAELWAWSGVSLGYGAAVMALGIWRCNRPLRLTALAIIALTAGKIFLVDMADLVGLWRVVSFLGLGLTLIGLGAAYRRFIAAGDAVGHASRSE